MPLALFALTISAFAIGMTEFVVVGLLPQISDDLKTSLPSTGYLISLYALGVSIGAPVLTGLTQKMNRKLVLLGLMSIFTLGNLIAWGSPSYSLLVIARILTGLMHGIFFSIGATIATSLVDKDKEASAIALMFSGLTVALVTGVPFGTWVGQEFGWRLTFLAIALFGVIAWIGILIFMPSNLQQPAATSLVKQYRAIMHPKLIIAYMITAIGYGGNFIAFTFLSPILQQVSGFSANTIVILLVIYGISVSLGNIIGGKLTDKIGPLPALIKLFMGLSAILFIFYFSAPSQFWTLLTLIIWGAFAFGNVPALQLFVVKTAEKYTPDAINIASGMNIAAFNLGIAGGAMIGGKVVDSYTLLDTTYIGGFVVLCAAVIVLILNSKNKQVINALSTS